MANVTGWNELFAGNVITSAFKLYDVALNGWAVAVLFFLFQALVYIKTRNFTTMWVTGILFVSMFATSTFVNVILKQDSLVFIFAILILELGGILYYLLFR